MVKAITSEELATTFEEHAEQTEEQAGRLETIFEQLGKAARGKKCVGMEGILKEGGELIKEEESSAALGAALICAAQKWSIMKWRPMDHWQPMRNCLRWMTRLSFCKQRSPRKKKPTKS